MSKEESLHFQLDVTTEISLLKTVGKAYFHIPYMGIEVMILEY